jgi:hypothetical protein
MTDPKGLISTIYIMMCLCVCLSVRICIPAKGFSLVVGLQVIIVAKLSTNKEISRK